MPKKAIVFADGVNTRETIQPALKKAGYEVREIFFTHGEELLDALKAADKDTVVVNTYNNANFPWAAQQIENHDIAQVMTHWSVGSGIADAYALQKAYPKAVLYDYGKPAQKHYSTRKGIYPNVVASAEFDPAALLKAVDKAFKNAQHTGSLSQKVAARKIVSDERAL